MPVPLASLWMTRNYFQYISDRRSALYTHIHSLCHVVYERKQDIQTEVIRGLDLLAHVAATVLKRIYSLEKESAR